MTHDRILQVHATDPFATRLDQVLAAVGDTERTGRVDGPDIASAEPPIGGPLVRLLIGAEVRLRDPGAADVDFAHRRVIPSRLSVVPNDAHVDEGDGPSLPRANLVLVVGRAQLIFRGKHAYGRDR